MNYKWAKNILKLQRAISLSTQGTEKDIMEKYISMGGLIDKEYAPEAPQDEVLPEIAEAVAEVIPEEESTEEVKKVVKKKK